MKNSFVMVADDDQASRLMIKSALAQNGLSIAEAQNGLEALRLLENLQPDLVLLDMFMPEMDGLETCRRIRGNPKGAALPVMIITANNDLANIRKAYDAGATDFMPKPINALVLKERVRYILRASATARGYCQNQELLTRAQAVASLGSFFCTPDTSKVRASEEFKKIFGLSSSKETIPWDAFWQKIHPEDRKTLDSEVARLQATGERFRQDIRILGCAKEERFAMFRMDAELDNDGKIMGLIGIVQDITERKMSELLERDQSQVMARIIRKEPLETILLETTQLLERQRSSSLAAICQVSDGRIESIISSSLPTGVRQIMTGSELSAENGTCAAAACLGQIVVAENISTSTYWKNSRKAALAHGIRSSASVPIFSGTGQIFGTVALMHRHVYKTSEADLKLMDLAARLASLAAEHHDLSERLNHQARHDHLTGLINRPTLNHLLAQTLKQAARTRETGAYLLIDLDRFKAVNDLQGHQTGDRLLQEVAVRLRKCVRDSDMLARVGGDEFVIILPTLRDKEDAARAASRVLQSLNTPFLIGAYRGPVEASIGISLFPRDGMEAAVLQKNADIAMYDAKNQGGNRFQFFENKMHERVVQRLQIENDLRKALERNEFELHYQPLLDLTSGSLILMEALIRWNHPERGLLLPNEFIPAAEESRLIIPIGQWVLREACRQNVAWQKQGFAPIRVSVNLSAVQFTEIDFAERVRKTLEETGMDPKWLEVEVTETFLMKDLGKAGEDLMELKNLGVTTTLDDFGSGYSSISYLQQMPLDCIKIDRHFIQNMTPVQRSKESKSNNFIQAFAGLAKNLHLRLIAEGIETEHQRNALTTMGYNIGQGFLFSAPVPAKDAIAFLENAGRQNGNDAAGRPKI